MREHAVRARAGDQQAVDAAVLHQALVGELGVAAAPVLDEHDDEGALPRALERSARDLGVDRVAQRRDEHPQRPGGGEPQTAGDVVGPVAQLGGRRLDPLARLGADVQLRRVAQHARDRGHVHAREAGDVHQGRRAWLRGAHRASIDGAIVQR